MGFIFDFVPEFNLFCLGSLGQIQFTGSGDKTTQRDD